MKQLQSKNLIYGKLFLISVLLLLLNDFYLKHHYHNYFTGKLSDFAGLFAFPYFVSLLIKSKVKPIYVLTGILFIFWKSSFSQIIIDGFNGMGIGINRVVDYSDLMALLILPISYQYRIRELIRIRKIRFIPKPIIIGICSFAFIATTLQSEYVELNLKSDYETQMEMPLDSVLNQMQVYYQGKADSKFYSSIDIPKKRSTIRISMIISDLDNHKTVIKLDSIFSFNTQSAGFFSGINKKYVEYMKSLRIKDYEELFVEQKINKLNKD